MITTTHFLPELARSEFMSVVTYTVPYYDDVVVEIDPLSPKLHDFVNALTSFYEYPYAGQQLTTIAYEYHRTTTTVWLILMVNGLLSRTELMPGMILKIPDLNDIQKVLRNMQLSQFRTPKVFGTRRI